MRRALFASIALAGAAASQAAPVELATLKAGDRAHRFETSAVYLDAADRPLGARFVHRPTGFQLDLLQIESVPQAFTWVKTFATSRPGRAAHAGAPAAAARHARPHAGHQAVDVAGDALGLHRDLAHELLLQHQRGPRHLLRHLRRAAARDAAPRLQRRRDPARGAQLRRHEERRRHAAPGGEGHGLQRDGGLDGQRRLAGLAGAEPRGLRHAAMRCRTTRAASRRASAR